MVRHFGQFGQDGCRGNRNPSARSGGIGAARPERRFKPTRAHPAQGKQQLERAGHVDAPPGEPVQRGPGKGLPSSHDPLCQGIDGGRIQKGKPAGCQLCHAPGKELGLDDFVDLGDAFASLPARR